MDQGDVDNVYWLPRPQNPADGLTEVKTDLVTLLCLLQAGSFLPGTRRPLRGFAFEEEPGATGLRGFFGC